MKIKDNEKIKKLKEKKQSFDILWDNPRYKSIIKLSIWFILILILSLVVRISNNNEPNKPVQNPDIKETTPKQQLQKINNYEAIINIDEQTLTTKKTNNKELITYQNNTYYYENNNLIIGEYNEFIFKTLFFNPNNIYLLIENIDEEYTTKYKDGTYITNYKVPTKIFIKNYNNNYIETEEFINITLEGNKETNKITINLNNIQLIEPTININNITINLNNVNNIQEINVTE
ncbi:MAG: hypothetical protein J6D28_05705 [Bacilli bacterium]|nr:hypothetical protein [Bacilli bacterium]